MFSVLRQELNVILSLLDGSSTQTKTQYRASLNVNTVTAEVNRPRWTHISHILHRLTHLTWNQNQIWVHSLQRKLIDGQISGNLHSTTAPNGHQENLTSQICIIIWITESESKRETCTVSTTQLSTFSAVGLTGTFSLCQVPRSMLPPLWLSSWQPDPSSPRHVFWLRPFSHHYV